MNKSNRQYIELDLSSIGLDFVKVQVKIEEEGVVLDIFNKDDDCINTNSKLWEDIVSDEWGLTLLQLLNKQHKESNNE